MHKLSVLFYALCIICKTSVALGLFLLEKCVLTRKVSNQHCFIPCSNDYVAF